MGRRALSFRERPKGRAKNLMRRQRVALDLCGAVRAGPRGNPEIPRLRLGMTEGGKQRAGRSAGECATYERKKGASPARNDKERKKMAGGKQPVQLGCRSG